MAEDSAAAAFTVAMVDADSEGLADSRLGYAYYNQHDDVMQAGAREIEVMKRKMMWTAGCAVIAMVLACLPAKAQQAMTADNSSPTERPKGKSFAKAADAAAALYAAARRDDDAELLLILGPDAKEIVEWSDDANERREQRARFAQKYEQMHRLLRDSPRFRLHLTLGLRRNAMGLGSLLDEVQPGAVLFSPLFDREHFVAKARELEEFLLNFLKTFMPLAVSDLGIGFVSALKPILFIQPPNVSDFRSETLNLFPKNFEMIHTTRITHLSVGRESVRQVGLA